MSSAIFNRKLKTFKSRMISTISATYLEMIQNPMYPDDPTKLIPASTSTTGSFKIQMVKSASGAEEYSEGSTGFMPDTYKWVLSLSAIPEGATFDFHGESYITGRVETLVYKDKVYGYRSSVGVRDI